MLKLKTTFSFRQKRGYDVRFPPVYYDYVLLPLVNKVAASAYSRAKYSQAGRDIKR